jgi:peptidoglycan/xylan/chitin deacetylase (PgdA/CDA1 family)
MYATTGPSVLAVMYHYVRDRGGTDDAGIRGLDTESFCRQLDLLCSRLDPVTWPMVCAWLRGRAAIPECCFLLTFDDGLADHADVVAPILEMRGLRGVFFVPGCVLESGSMDAAHQVHLLQARLGDDKFAQAVTDWLARNGGDDWLDALDEDEAGRIYHYETPDRARVKYLLAYVLPFELRDRMVDALFRRHVGDPDAFARKWYLDLGQIRMLEAAGHTIGGHGYAHAPLLRLSPSEQALELSRSAAVLLDALGPGTRPFSYPFGSVDEAVARRCAEAGFVHGFTTVPGWIRLGNDPHLLGRVDTIAAERFLERQELCTLQC